MPNAMQGRDLSAALVHPEQAVGGRPASVYLQEATAGDQAVKQAMLPWRGVRTERYTYARNLDGPWMLFDNEADPYQLRNLARDAGFAGVCETLEAEMRGWMARTDDVLEPLDDLMARAGLSEAWAEREAFLHRGGNMSGAPTVGPN